LAEVLEMLLEQNCSVQKQCKAQQMLLDISKQQQEMTTLKDRSKEGTEDSLKVKLPQPTLQKLRIIWNIFSHF